MEHVQQEEGVLLATLQRLFPQSSTSTLRKMLTQGRVMVNETVVYRAKHDLRQGDNVRVLDRQKAEEHSPPPPTQPPVDLDILYEDDSLLVVNNPLFSSPSPPTNWSPIHFTAAVCNISNNKTKTIGVSLFTGLTKKPQA